MTELSILHADSELVVAIKPPGLLAVPGRGPDKQDCLIARLRPLFPRMIAQPAVHRLDMATSGLMVVALTVAAHRHLSEQFARRQVQKCYQAILSRITPQQSGIITLAFRLDPDNRPRQIYDPQHGKTGITRWHKLADEPEGSRVAFFPETGRTHQLRVHAAHPLGLNAPIAGDSLYGEAPAGSRLLLHATELCFTHPESSRRLQFHSAPDF